MKRNFGSLNLAALDLNTSANSSLEERFSAMDPSAEDFSMDGSEYSSDENVGFPLERMDLHSAPLRDEEPQDVDMDMEDVMPELVLPRSDNEDVRVSRLTQSTASEIQQHLHDQHHVELNALRCLSLKVMLSNLSTPSNSSANATAASKPNYAYPGVNDRAKTALLPIRQPSLQSV